MCRANLVIFLSRALAFSETAAVRSLASTSSHCAASFSRARSCVKLSFCLGVRRERECSRPVTRDSPDVLIARRLIIPFNRRAAAAACAEWRYSCPSSMKVVLTGFMKSLYGSASARWRRIYRPIFMWLRAPRICHWN